jgi:hypothetical protein
MAEERLNLPMRIIFEFVGGGIMDGTAMIDREIKVGDRISFEEMAVGNAYWQSEFGQVGRRFRIISPGRLARTAITEHAPDAMDAYEYEVTNRLEGDNELLLQARFVGQVTFPHYRA